MSRRDTIIISVLVNAALLVVLFITAVTTKEPVEKQSNQIALLEETMIDSKELFAQKPEEIKEPQQSLEKEQPQEFISLAQENMQVKPEEKVVYQLPKVVEKEQGAIAPVSNDLMEVVVQKGDTLEKIANKYNVKVAKLYEINNLSNSFLKIGQVLLVPKTEAVSVVKQQKQISQHAQYYTVKVGDNPYTIAIKHNVKPSELLKLNNLDDKKAKKLKPGDKLRVR